MRKEKTAELVVSRGGQDPRRWKEGGRAWSWPKDGTPWGNLRLPYSVLRNPVLEEARLGTGSFLEAYALSCSALRVPNGAGRQQGHGPHDELHTQNTNPRNSPELRLWPLH